VKCVSDFCIKKTEHWSTIVDREPCKCGTCSWYWLFVVQVLTIRGARLQPQSITLLLESCGWTSMVTWILWTIKKEWSATSSIYHTATSHEIYNARWGRHLPYSYFTRDIRDKVRQTLTVQLLHTRYTRQGEGDTYHTATSHEIYNARWGRQLSYSYFTRDIWDKARQTLTIQLLHARQGEADTYHTATSHETYETRWGRHLPYSYFTRDIRDKVRQTHTIQLLHMRHTRQGEADTYHTATSHEIYETRWGRHLPFSYFTCDIWDKVRQTLTLQLLHTRYTRRGEADTYHSATSHEIYETRWGRHLPYSYFTLQNPS